MLKIEHKLSNITKENSKYIIFFAHNFVKSKKLFFLILFFFADKTTVRTIKNFIGEKKDFRQIRAPELAKVIFENVKLKAEYVFF